MVDVTQLLSGLNLSAIMPTGNELLNNLVAGAAGTVVLAGLKSQAGQDALDPLHLVHKDPAAGAASSTVIGKSITAAAFASLPAASQAQILAAGYVIAG